MEENKRKKKHSYPANRKTSTIHRVQPQAGDNTKFLTHNLQVAALAPTKFPIQTATPEEVKERIRQYFELCAQNDVKPGVASLALAFGISRNTFHEWVSGITKSVTKENREILNQAYQVLNAQMEDYMMNGKIHPVAGIFLMKNNMGYEDNKKLTVTNSDPLGDTVSEDVLREKYLRIAEEDTPKLTKQ